MSISVCRRLDCLLPLSILNCWRGKRRREMGLSRTFHFTFLYLYYLLLRYGMRETIGWL